MSDLFISERQAGDVAILDLSGKITIGEGSVGLRTAIRRLIDEGKARILLNFNKGELSYVDSSGIGELVSSFTAIHRAGGKVKIFGLSQSLIDLLTITRILQNFDVFENEDEALASFESQPAVR